MNTCDKFKSELKDLLEKHDAEIYFGTSNSSNVSEIQGAKVMARVGSISTLLNGGWTVNESNLPKGDETEITIIWDVEDVINRAKEYDKIITYAQALDVLSLLDEQHDCN